MHRQLTFLLLLWMSASFAEPTASVPTVAFCGKHWAVTSEAVTCGELQRVQRGPWEVDFARWNDTVHDLRPLAQLPALRSLDLSGCVRVRDLTPLAALTKLETLTLSRTAVTSLAGLEGLVGLRSLDLSKTQVQSLAALGGLGALETLTLEGTPLKDLRGLGKLTALRELVLDNTEVVSLVARGSRSCWLQANRVKATTHRCFAAPIHRASSTTFGKGAYRPVTTVKVF